MFNYQSSFLEIGHLVKNFYDAISEGDGLRVLRCWKFMLLYLKEDGASSRKYALEALYLQCQVNALLTHRPFGLEQVFEDKIRYRWQHSPLPGTGAFQQTC